MGLFVIELLLGRCAEIHVLHWQHIISCAIGKVLITLRKLEFGSLSAFAPNKCFLGGETEALPVIFGLAHLLCED